MAKLGGWGRVFEPPGCTTTVGGPKRPTTATRRAGYDRLVIFSTSRTTTPSFPCGVYCG